MGTTVIGGTYIQLPTGNTAERPASPQIGMMRYNTDGASYEVYKASGWADIDLDLAPGTQFNTTSMTHGIYSPPGAGSNLLSGGSTSISNYGAAAASVAGNGTFGLHGMHSGQNAFPAYWAVFLGTPKRAINRLVMSVHGNCFGYFYLEGSNDCGNSSGFASNGTWTTLSFSSSNNGYNNQNMGGTSSGVSDGTQFTFNYNNNTGYLAYRVRFVDGSRRDQAMFTSYAAGCALYWIRLDRA